jgi:predicted acyl esterase
MEGAPIRYVVPEADGWRSSATWPPPETKLRAFALRSDGALIEEEGTLGSRAYIHLKKWKDLIASHPSTPHPRGAPTEGSFIY